MTDGCKWQDEKPIERVLCLVAAGKTSEPDGNLNQRRDMDIDSDQAGTWDIGHGTWGVRQTTDSGHRTHDSLICWWLEGAPRGPLGP